MKAAKAQPVLAVLTAALTAMLAMVVPVAEVGAISTFRSTCDQSPLCDTLANIWQFEEVSDSTRLDSLFAVDLVENDGQNVAQDTTNKKLGSAAASFSGLDGNYLYLPESAGLGEYAWTLSVWIRPTSAGLSGDFFAIVTRVSVSRPGTSLWLTNSGGSLYPGVAVTRANDDALISVTSASSISLNAWHLVTAKYEPWHPSRNATLYLQVDNGTTQTNTSPIDYFIRSDVQKFIVGGWDASITAAQYKEFVGQMDQLTHWGETLSTGKTALFWNGGNGKAYPFN